MRRLLTQGEVLRAAFAVDVIDLATLEREAAALLRKGSFDAPLVRVPETGQLVVGDFRSEVYLSSEAERQLGRLVVR